jgi:hypothetical protein
MNESNEETTIYQEPCLKVMANLCRGSSPLTHEHVNLAITALCSALVDRKFTDEQILIICL